MRRLTRSEPVIAAPETRIARWLTDTCVDVIYLFQMAAANVNNVDVVLAMCGVEAVSYTHLTLPTIYSV